MMLLAKQPVMANRAKINSLFNGDAPDTEQERREQNLKTNANWLEGTRIISNATNQLNNALTKGDRYFTVRLDVGPAHMRSIWGEEITLGINKELKRCRDYKSTRESANAQVALHSIGPVVWRNRRSVVPDVCGIDDLLMPASTLTSFTNLDRFAIYREMTWGQLYDQSQGDFKDSGWNKDYITALLAALYKTPLQPTYQGNRWLFPEKIQEDIKEGSSQMGASSLPKFLAWDFFFRNEETGKWNRRMIPDYANIAVGQMKGDRLPINQNQDFVYSRDDYADSWQEIFHCYIGNCSNVAPYRCDSSRSIGYLLYGVCMVQNKLRNRLYDHMFQQLLTWFRNVSEDHREKIGLIDLQNFGILPDGVSMVTAGERHVADWNLILMGLNQGRQLMSESSAGFIPDAAGESEKAMTAREVMVRQAAAVTMTSAVLNQLGEQSKYEYREICRRFCIKDNRDPMAVRFRKRLQERGIPLAILDAERWDVIPEQTVGGGNKASELMVTESLMQEMYPISGPDGQRIIARRRYLALTDNADEALMVVPEAPAPPSDDVQYAQMAYSILMLGLPFQVKEGANLIAYTGTLLGLMNMNMQQAQAVMQQPQGLPIAADRIAGLFNVAQHAQQQIQLIGQDKNRLPVAKQLFKALNEMMGNLQNMAKQLQALEQQQAQQQGGIDPETQARIQAMMMTAQTQNQITSDKAQKKQQEKDIAFMAENRRKDLMAHTDAQRKLLSTHADVVAKDLTTRGELLRQQQEPAETTE